jgi:hypothetical protein
MDIPSTLRNRRPPHTIRPRREVLFENAESARAVTKSSG